jgi:restriction system protein
MPTLGMRLSKALGDGLRLKIDINELLEVEAIANYYLQLHRTADPEQNMIFEELREKLASKPDMLDRLVEVMPIHLAHCPFFTKTTPSTELLALRSLFVSEQLPVDDKNFFDQRFINYLAMHSDKLPHMHWRQFEGMAAEWFARQGYDVELGPGRNDGSIDIRLWNEKSEPGAPPAVIVQCKRQDRKIERVVVKALYADVLHEKAASGLIVTTSDISPGARRDCQARSYPITTANRSEVTRWIKAMRKPGAGIVYTPPGSGHCA